MNDVSAIFDAAIRASKFVRLKSKYAAKVSQLNSVQAKKCGNCDHWMKSSCVPEKKHRSFKSAGSPACSDFVLAYGSKLLVSKFNDELKKIEAETKEWLEAE